MPGERTTLMPDAGEPVESIREACSAHAELDGGRNQDSRDGRARARLPNSAS
jgi:hypothetical protein